MEPTMDIQQIKVTMPAVGISPCSNRAISTALQPSDHRVDSPAVAVKSVSPERFW